MIRNQKRKPVLTAGASVSEGATSRTWIGAVAAALRGQLAASAAGVLVGAIGMLGFILSPLKDMAFEKIWTERAELRILPSATSIPEGGIFRYSVLVRSTSRVPVREGVLQLQVDPEYLHSTRSALAFITPKLTAPREFPTDSMAQYVAERPGRTTVRAVLATARDTFQSELQITITSASETTGPTQHNLSGVWPIRIGTNRGHMKIRHEGIEITGSYALDSGITGAVNGTADGDNFEVDLLSGSSTFKWFVNAKRIINGEFLKIEGPTTEFRAGEQGWVETATVAFYSTQKIR
jgi:hypothetical protein